MPIFRKKKARAAHETSGSGDHPAGVATQKQHRLTVDDRGGQSFLLYRVRARALVIGCGVVTVAALASTAVVASVNDADTLSTVALGLAVIAFVVQIVVYVAQAGASEAHRLHAEQLNAQTGTLLAEVRATTASTQQLVHEQFQDVLRAFLGGTARTAEETKLDPERLEKRLLENVRAQIGPEAERVVAEREARAELTRRARELRPTRASRTSRENSGQQPLQAERLQKLTTFPDEAVGRPLLEQLRELPGSSQYRLGELGRDVIDSTQIGIYEGLTYAPFKDDALLAAGLVKRHRTRNQEGEIADLARLTNEGEAVARLMTATGELPAWLDLTNIQTDDDIPF